MTEPLSAAIVVFVTASSREEAETIGRALVADRLAACVNVVGPIRSIYRWQDAVEEADEWLLIVKARAADLPALDARVREAHSYEVPEVLALSVAGGSEAYLRWLADATDRSR
jgi:periplasmic divalent cation tolerance protein